MSDKYFVDTNILVYSHDRSAGPKHQQARTLIESLWESGLGVLSTQVLQELCINLRPCMAENKPAAQCAKHLQRRNNRRLIA